MDDVTGWLIVIVLFVLVLALPWLGIVFPG